MPAAVPPLTLLLELTALLVLPALMPAAVPPLTLLLELTARPDSGRWTFLLVELSA